MGTYRLDKGRLVINLGRVVVAVEDLVGSHGEGEGGQCERESETREGEHCEWESGG